MSFACTYTNHALHIQSKAEAVAISWDREKIDRYRADINKGIARKIPSLAIFHFDQTSNSVQDSRLPLPCVADLAAHLELLETFHALRQRVLASTEIDDAFGIQPNRTVKSNYRGDSKTLKDHTLKERRQVKWPKFVEFAVVRFLHWKDVLGPRPKGAVLDKLPPLDILMVWHTFLLNPQLYNQYCRDDNLYWIRMPWEAIHSAINNLDWDYEQPAEEKSRFEGLSRIEADLFQQFSTWYENSKLSNAKSLKRPTDYSLHSDVNPSLGTQGLVPTEYCVLSDKDRLTAMSSSLTSKQRTIATEQHEAAARYAHLFRKYGTDGNSLSLQLRDAVLRQCDFVDKMNQHLWIRSPALAGTLRRATDRYAKFLNLIRVRPGLKVVPTLDIDLVWHTHQCTGGFYVQDVRKITGRFVNHNDKLGKAILDDAFSETKKYFKFHFVEEYDRCGCWECESLLDCVEEVVASGSGRIDMDEIAGKVRKDVAFHRQMEIATRTRFVVK